MAAIIHCKTDNNALRSGDFRVWQQSHRESPATGMPSLEALRAILNPEEEALLRAQSGLSAPDCSAPAVCGVIDYTHVFSPTRCSCSMLQGVHSCCSLWFSVG